MGWKQETEAGYPKSSPMNPSRLPLNDTKSISDEHPSRGLEPTATHPNERMIANQPAEALGNSGVRTYHRPVKNIRKYGRQRDNVFRCSTCDSFQVQSFKTVWGSGTSKSIMWKGLFLKSGYRTISRQSETAKVCQPPRKASYWVSAGAFLIFCSGTYLGFLAPRHSSVFSEMTYAAAIVAVLSLLWTFWYRARIYPHRIDEWNRSVYCRRCGSTTLLAPEAFQPE